MRDESDSAVEEAYGLLTDLGVHGWDVDVVGARGRLVLTASKDGIVLKGLCSQVVDAALHLYATARLIDRCKAEVRH